MNLPPEIEKARRQIETHAREYGLDFYDVVFEVLDYDQLNEVAAYGGGRFKADVEEAFPGHEKIVTSEIRDRDEIYDAIKRVLGKGL